jgi:Dit-like tail protein
MAARLWIFQDGTPSFGFDAVIREQHARELTVPQEPTEAGFVVADHAYLQPDRLSIEAAVSDIALRPSASDPFASSASRSVKAFDLIRKLQESMEPFSVQTGLLLYDNMEITSFSADQDARTSSALIFRAEMTRIRITSTRTVTFPPRKKGKPARQGAKKVDNGTQAAQDVKDHPKPKAIFLQTLNSLGASDKSIGDFFGSFFPGATP